MFACLCNVSACLPKCVSVYKTVRNPWVTRLGTCARFDRSLLETGDQPGSRILCGTEQNVRKLFVISGRNVDDKELSEKSKQCVVNNVRNVCLHTWKRAGGRQLRVTVEVAWDSVYTRMCVLFCIFQVLKNNHCIFYQKKIFFKVINSYCYPGLCF